MTAETYQRHRPAPSLVDAVEEIWIQENDANTEMRDASCVLPTGTVEIIFNYGDPLVHVEAGGHRRMPEAYITGQRTRPVYPKVQGRVGLIVVSLYPWAVQQLFPECVEEIDGYTDLRLLHDGRRVARTLDALRDAREPQERMAAVEAYLLQRRENIELDLLMRHAVVRLHASCHDSWIDTVAREHSLSRRHFGRRFKSAVGLSPKLFARIQRFQRALGLRRRGFDSWAGIAAHCGFTDQAHLTREFRLLGDQTPTELVRPRSTPDQVFNGHDGSRFFDTIYL